MSFVVFLYLTNYLEYRRVFISHVSICNCEYQVYLNIRCSSSCYRLHVMPWSVSSQNVTITGQESVGGKYRGRIVAGASRVVFVNMVTSASTVSKQLGLSSHMWMNDFELHFFLWHFFDGYC